MSESKTIEIGDCRYVMKHARASQALKAAAILANGLAPLLNGFRRGREGAIDRLMLGVAETMADPALADHVEKLCEIFKPCTQVVMSDGRSFSLGGDHGIFETHFAGRVDALIKWLTAAVEYDLGGFLGEMKAKFQAASAAAEAESKSVSPPDAAKTG